LAAVGGGREAVVEVDAVTAVLLPRFGDHLLGLVDLVADRFFTEHVAAGLQRLHRGFVVIGTELQSAGGDADQVGLELAEHFVGVVEGGSCESRSGGVGALLLDVADAHELRERIALIDPGVAVADRTHSDDANPQHRGHCEEELRRIKPPRSGMLVESCVGG
jgi:hypothetical protein